jgi:2-C-methyl-D-erythritol 2,4-cyclodiphosphate synthase
MRIGIGYDVHPLVKGRKLILGGVEIPFEKGLDGYSDADVLVHAIMDALLGAAGLKDIGQQFPTGDPQHKDASSIHLLEHVGRLVAAQGYRINNVDSVLIAQAPMIAPYVDEMRKKIAVALRTDIGNVMVKATTTDKLGFTGRGEGMAAEAVTLLSE